MKVSDSEQAGFVSSPRDILRATSSEDLVSKNDLVPSKWLWVLRKSRGLRTSSCHDVPPRTDAIATSVTMRFSNTA